MRRLPDPFALAVILTLITFAEALAAGVGAGRVLDAWQSDAGLWRLLRFGMQMCLILVTGHALASAPPVARFLERLSGRPTTAQGVAALTAGVSVAVCLIHWGLGLIVGAVFARAASDSAHRRGIAVDRGVVAAAGYSGMMAWHCGLSGSAPLKVTLNADLVRLLGQGLADRIGAGAIPLDRTVFAPANGFVALALLMLAPVVFGRLAERAPDTDAEQAAPAATPPPPPTTLDQALAWVVALLIGASLVRWVGGPGGLSRLDPNVLNAAFLAAGLALHGSLSAYSSAIGDAARGCAGIILQFPFYAGILGVMAVGGFFGRLSGALEGVMSEATLPLWTFLSAGFLNLFVPSGGGQWALQGPLALTAALDLGVDPAAAVLAVAWGDQWTNMLQPFWALPLLAITGVSAARILPYTSRWMAVGGVVFCLGLALV